MYDIIRVSREEYEFFKLENVNDLANQKRFFWIRFVQPSQEEIEFIEKVLSFEPEDTEDLKDFLKEGGRPVLSKESFIEVIYSVPYTESDGDIVTEPIAIYIKKNFVLTIEKKALPACEKIIKLISKKKARYLFKKNTIFFLAQLIDKINDEFLFNVNKIASRTDILSSRTDKLTEKQIDSISSASTTLAFFNQAIIANIEVLNGLRKMHHRSFTDDDRDTFNDLYSDARQVLDVEKVQREVIMNIFNLQSIISTNHINEFMKKLTSLALIITVPMLISGIYGMNINGLPFATHKFSFWIIMGIMAIITTIIYIIFKKIDWV
jgi:magnesium transporter